MNKVLHGILFVWSVALMVPAPALAHGTSEPGPHGGEIRMPGAFHVEAVSKDGELLIYLLDMQFQSPLTANSSVAVELEQRDGTVTLQCMPAEERKVFTCPLPEESDLQRGALVVRASRDGLPAEPAEYQLPLAWSE